MPILVADDDVVARTVGFDFHRGVIASAQRRPLPAVADVVSGTQRIAVLEGLNDPENLGLIARSARAFGVEALILDPTCIDPYYRRTVRVSMGEVLLLDVARADDWPADIDAAPRRRVRDLGDDTRRRCHEHLGDRVPERLAIVLGAEGPGLQAETQRRPSRRVRIPISADVDSVNVGHAAAIAFAITARRGGDPPRGDDGTRTHNPHLAKVMRYQLRHVPGGLQANGSVLSRPSWRRRSE